MTLQRRGPKGGRGCGRSDHVLLPLQGAQKHLKENVMQSDNVSAHAVKEDENPELAGEAYAAGCEHLAGRDASTDRQTARRSP